MSFCSKCGAQLVEDARFCNICGASVAAPVPVQTPVYEPVQTPVYEPEETAVLAPEQTPAYEPVQAPAYEPVQTPAPEPVQAPVYEPVQTPAPQFNNNVYQQPVYNAAPQPAYNPAPAPQPVKTAEQLRSEEQSCLDALSKKMRWEVKGWRIGGIVLLACALIIIISGFVLIGANAASVSDMAPADIYDYYDDYYDDLYDYYNDYYDYGYNYGYSAAKDALVGAGIGYVITGFIFVGIGIFSLIFATKVSRMVAKIYTDCTDAVNHAGSVGSIVLGAIFNTIALIFIIINFIFVKNNRATFDRIKANQQSFNNRQF